MIPVTINTIDSFVGLMGYALRRRTSFLCTNVDCALISNCLGGRGSALEELVSVLEEINRTIPDSN